MDEGIAVLIAASMAILGIFYASRQQRLMLRKQHTYQVLEKLNDWEDFEKNLDFASALIKEGRIPHLCDERKPDCDRIDFLLNYYEFLSAAIVSGDIDEWLVRRVERLRLTRVFMKFIVYVQENREDRNSEAMWENLEFMAHRWAVVGGDPFDKIVDRILLRPNQTSFYADRSGVWDALVRKSKEIK